MVGSRLNEASVSRSRITILANRIHPVNMGNPQFSKLWNAKKSLTTLDYLK